MNPASCPDKSNHTPGFQTGSYGTGPTLHGKPIKLTGGKKTHVQLQCETCKGYFIIREVEKL